MSGRSEAHKNNFKKFDYELSKKLAKTEEDYAKETKKIIKILKERKKVNEEFLSNIETFIEYAKNQTKNNLLSKESRLRYKDLIEEEQSLRYRIREDLKRNNELIKSIKKSTEILLH